MANSCSKSVFRRSEHLATDVFLDGEASTRNICWFAFGIFQDEEGGHCRVRDIHLFQLGFVTGKIRIFDGQQLQLDLVNMNLIDHIGTGNG